MIALPEGALAQIREHACKAYPEECCGALLGVIEEEIPRVTRVERTANTSSDERRRRFRITPEEYRRVERLADAEGLALLGFYHSHPDHPAAPSAYDREHALPFFHYLVMGVDSGRPGEITSWVLSESRGGFEREVLLVGNPEE